MKEEERSGQKKQIIPNSRSKFEATNDWGGAGGAKVVTATGMLSGPCKLFFPIALIVNS